MIGYAVGMMTSPLRAGLFALAVATGSATIVHAQPGFGPGQRVLVDAHNCYPEGDAYADRIDRALATGLPVAIEQDLVWRPATDGRPAHSIVSHGEPFTGREPSLRQHFFERIRPLVEAALRDGDRRQWPLITLNLDFKSVEPEHLAEIWAVLGEFEAWLTTAPRTATPDQPAPLDVRPVLVLTGDHPEQQAAFHDRVPVGGRLRLFGAILLRPDEWMEARLGKNADREVARREFWTALRDLPLPSATNYRRWWNNAWWVVEGASQPKAGDWSPEEDARLKALVKKSHAAGLWIRYYTLNGHGADVKRGWTDSYNFGSPAAAETRWRAAIAAGVDFIATDQYEDVARTLTRK